MAEWIYTKDRLPDDCEGFKWVAVHYKHGNCNEVKVATYSHLSNCWYDEYSNELPLDPEDIYAWKDYEKPSAPEYRG